MVRSLRAAGVAVQVALEPTGSYGDALRHQLAQHDVEVYRVSGKRTHDAREVYDGVPSLHDAKSAAIIAKLHFDGASTLWPTPADAKRRLQASIARMEMFKSHYLRLVNMLEGLIARHWPEVALLVELTAPTLLALLARFGRPSEVAADTQGARRLMHSVSNGLMTPTKIDAVLASAAVTVGVPVIDEERTTLQTLAAEAHRALRARQWLWLAALRWLMKDRNAKAWFDKKVARDGGKKARAVVALMRKLAMGLFHVARGETFDSAKLFDATRLELAS